MKKEDFKIFVETQLIPLIPGLTISKVEEPAPKSKVLLSQIGSPTKLGIKPLESSNFRIIVERSQSFDKVEKDLILSILNEFSLITNYPKSYELFLFEQIVANGISSFLKPNAKNSISIVINHFNELASRSYEGQRISMGIAFSDKIASSATNIEEILNYDYGIVLSNGVSTLLECSNDGGLIGYLEVNDYTPNPETPITFTPLANYTSDTTIALVLNRNGEILIFRNKKLLITKRRGSWQFYPHNVIKKQIAARTNKAWTPELRASIYESSLDCSFARTGGLIALVKRTKYSNVLAVLNNYDLISSGTTSKSKFFNTVRLSKFPDISRRIRQEILSIDGAVVIRYDGNIINVGSMVTKIDPTQDGGARSAAARTLSESGVSIKISMDGKITCFAEKNGSPEIIVTFG